MDSNRLRKILEAILLTADSPQSIGQLKDFFAAEDTVGSVDIKAGLVALQEACQDRSYSLQESAGGYSLVTDAEFQCWVSQHFEARSQRMSQSYLETLALIVWRQPITRAEIESVRGVSVNTNVIKSLFSKGWIRVVGQKEVPGRPELLGTTPQFLDDFQLKSLSELPDLSDLGEFPMSDPQLGLWSDARGEKVQQGDESKRPEDT